MLLINKFLTKRSNHNILIYAMVTSFAFISSPLLGQKTSTALDSIHNLNENDYENMHLYESLFTHYEKTKNYTQLGSDAHQLGKWFHKKKETKKAAINMMKRAINARIKAEPYDPDLLKRSYNNLGLYYYRDEKYKSSIKIYKKLVTITETNYLIGRGYSKIGECYNHLEDPYAAIDNLHKAFYYLKENKTYLARNHIIIARAYRLIRNNKNVDQALNHLKQAEQLLLESEKIDKERLFLVYNDLGGWYFERLQDTLNGGKYFKKALKKAEKLDMKNNISIISYNIGITFVDRDNLEAKKYFDISLKNPSNDLLVSRSANFGMGLLHNSNKKFENSETSYYKSLSDFFDTTINYQNIIPKLTKKKLSSIKDQMFLLEILKSTIDNYIDWGIQEKEIQHHQKAITLVEISDILINIMLENTLSDDSKLLWRNIASGTYAAGIQASFEANDIAYGFYLSEKNKALLLQQEILKESAPISSVILEKEHSIQREIISLQETYETSNRNKDSIFSLLYNKKEQLYTFKDSIHLLYPNYHTLKQKPLIIPLSEITLEENEIIIQYMMTERIAGLFPNTYCLLFSKDSKKIFKLENTKSLHNKIYNLRQQLSVPFRSKEDILTYQENSYDLYTSLFPKEIRSLLKDKKITIIPDHLISTIPFEALVTDPHSGKYLLEDSEISYTYSLSFQKQNTNRKRNAKKEFLGIAPRGFGNNLTSLSNSTKEVEIANSFYSGLLLLDKKATKDNFIKEIANYKIIHLATHAFAADSITPWIAFRDQKMVSPEIGLLKNNADMVVLSACNTSLGKVHSGEGVLSLARGFFKSGAHTVIPSLWSTNDKSTATITSDFYKNLSEGKTKSAALRAAKLTYLRNNTDAEASPHYWASLVLIGDTGTLLPASDYPMFIYIGIAILLIVLLSIFIFRKYKKK